MSSRGEQMQSLATLYRHMTTLALGGAHPLMVVVPRDELTEILAVADDVLRPESSPACPADPKEQT